MHRPSNSLCEFFLRLLLLLFFCWVRVHGGTGSVVTFAPAHDTNTPRTLLPPPTLPYFSASAPCEAPLISSYYSNLMNTPCIQIPMLSNWKCMSLNPSSFPPVAGTQALVTIIILGVLGGYWYHMKTFGGHGLPLHLFFANAKR